MKVEGKFIQLSRYRNDPSKLVEVVEGTEQAADEEESKSDTPKAAKRETFDENFSLETVDRDLLA
jgi:hypothetical protein